MSKLLPADTVLGVSLYLESDGRLLLTLNDHEAGYFDLAELVHESLEFQMEGAESHAEAVAGVQGLNRHIAQALVQVTQKLGPLLQEAAEDGDAQIEPDDPGPAKRFAFDREVEP